MDIKKIMLEITYIIAHDDFLHSAYKNGWITFRNFIIQYDMLLDDIIQYNNAFLIVDFYRKAFDKCKTMRTITNDFHLTNKEADKLVKKNINIIIDNYIYRISRGIKKI